MRPGISTLGDGSGAPRGLRTIPYPQLLAELGDGRHRYADA